MWITQLFQRLISLIKFKFEIAVLFFSGVSHLIKT